MSSRQCEARSGLYECTLPNGHTGRHEDRRGAGAINRSWEADPDAPTVMGDVEPPEWRPGDPCASCGSEATADSPQTSRNGLYSCFLGLDR